MKDEKIDVLKFDWVVSYFKHVDQLVGDCRNLSQEEKAKRFDELSQYQREFRQQLERKEF